MYHPIRFVGIAAMLIVLLVGGLVVSVKIGGGSNLHNLDAYFTLLWVFFSYILFERSVPDLDSSDFRQSEFEYQSQTTDSPKTNTKSGLRREKVFLTSLGLTIVIPIWFALVQFGAFFQSEYKFDTVEKDLNTLKESVQKVSRKGGDILFVTNRHLLTFGIIEDVPLIPEYERVFLMEMVMGNNLEYLGRFQKEIRDREYALIVIEPLFTKRKGSTERFGEENDEWVKQVAKHIRCSYKPIEELPDVNIFLYGPRKGKNPCK